MPSRRALVAATAVVVAVGAAGAYRLAAPEPEPAVVALECPCPQGDGLRDPAAASRAVERRPLEVARQTAPPVTQQSDDAADQPATEAAPAEPAEPTEPAVPESAAPDADPQAGAPTDPADPAPSTPPTPRPCPTCAPSAGVPDDVTLRPADTAALDRDGQLVEGTAFPGDVTLSADGVTLRGVRVEGQLLVTGSDVVVEDSEVGSLAISGASGVRVSRVEVFGDLGQDGIHVTSDRGPVTDVVVEDSWIHSPTVTGDSHYDGIQVRGVDGLVLRGNVFDLGPHLPQLNASIFLQEANGGNRDVLIEDNVIDGGGYALYIGGSDVTVRSNAFGRNAAWGLLYPDASPFTEASNVWRDTGEAVTLQ